MLRVSTYGLQFIQIAKDDYEVTKKQIVRIGSRVATTYNLVLSENKVIGM